ncbi:MAG: response regulator, partial [Acidobacteriota bacterium]|nr:response regulator [Acidobacteriota bacterium]
SLTLQKAGYSALDATTDPREALNRYDAFTPDLMLLDLMMPYVDGLSLIETIQARARGNNYVPILVITADLVAETQQKALSTGAKDFITKPFDPTEVSLRVANLLETRYRYIQFRNQSEVLDEMVRERTASLERAQVECLQRLARAAEFRDDATAHHVQRVGHLAGLLGREMGLMEDRVRLLRDAATLHDIGKIGIPDRILLKPGKLTSEEFDQMKGHTKMGAEILAGSHFPVLKLAEEIAWFHHERWDGDGYNRISGKNIPVESRIVSIADTFDVLTHDRPYRSAWTTPEAIAEIRGQRERQFDPRLVEIFSSAPWIYDSYPGDKV